ncbi:MAG: hypothetical protein AB6733_12335 [Clostridiaceae bacterium]
MKNFRKLTLKQKKVIKKLGLDPEDWLRVSLSAESLTIINKKTGKTEVVRY